MNLKPDFLKSQRDSKHFREIENHYTYHFPRFFIFIILLKKCFFNLINANTIIIDIIYSI